jgi:hypothetical protein
MEEIMLLSDAMSKRFKVMYGEPKNSKDGKMKGKPQPVKQIDDMMDEFEKMGVVREV